MKISVLGNLEEFDVVFREFDVTKPDILRTEPMIYAEPLTEALQFLTDVNLLPITSKLISPIGIYHGLMQMGYDVSPDAEFTIQYNKWIASNSDEDEDDMRVY